ncbi:MAG: TonB-dependent receptor [Candidatus Omnitrophica bacterium]|nr:TonB-dependent receptor [Candidatus Omnitrophota bacterium]
MKKRRIEGDAYFWVIIVFLAQICCIGEGYTQENTLAEQFLSLGEIVVTPFRIPSSAYSQGIHLNVIDKDAFEKKQLFTVGESIMYTEGIDVVSGGTLGGTSAGVNIRGAQTRHTAYMFEGIKLYDPSNTSAYYVPSDFLVNGLEKIEVVKLPLSSLYGSSPMGGVINFIAKKPRTRPYVSLTTMGGSYSTQAENLELGGQVNRISYLFNFSRIDSRGTSQAKEKNNNPEKDAYQNTNLTFNLNYTEPEDIEMGFAFHGIHARRELDDDDNLDGIPEDDIDNLSWNNEFVGTVYVEKTLNDYISYRVQGGITSLYRKYRDDNAGGGDEYTQGWYRGQTYQFLNHFEVTPCDWTKVLIGYDYTREKMDGYRYTFDYTWMFGFESDSPKEIVDTKGWFSEVILTPAENVEFDFSYRRQDHPIFKAHSVFKTGVSYSPWDALTLSTSYSEGFKAPSLYQLYSTNGNTDLQPEESETWEVGFDLKCNDSVSLGVAYFHSNFRNLIDFVYTNPSLFIGKYLNAGKAESEGIEIKADAAFGEHLTLSAGYTYLNGDQDFVDQDFVTIFQHSLIRVPTHKAFLQLGWKLGKLNTYFDLLYAGKRIDRVWVGMFDEFVTMKSYLLGNLSFEYAVGEHNVVFFKINNLFDKDYERIKGYQQERISFYGGMKLNF